MACRDGLLQQSCLEQYCSNTGGGFWSNMAGNYSEILIGFLVCALDSVNRFQYPFVQSDLWLYGFRFWKGELPENLFEKVMPTSNFDPWWWNLRFSWKNDEICEIEKLTKFAWKINLRSVSDVKIHRGPALRAIFRFSAEPLAWSMGGSCAWYWCMQFWWWIWILIREHAQIIFTLT